LIFDGTAPDYFGRAHSISIESQAVKERAEEREWKTE